MSEGAEPRIREHDIRHAFHTLGKIENGLLTNPYGRPIQTSKVVSDKREGVIGHWVDALIGERKVQKPVTRWTDGIDAHTERLVQIIIDERNKIKNDNLQNINNSKLGGIK